ncbi:MAG TPA: HAD family hydrolase [Methylomirabilota bacterium]|jgi:putative hydrolase of the HAD superfamily|nr:HAD family hydrolase [Methylomirabilota bacterium]
MIKIILFDGDGVIINKPMLFSQHLSNDYNVPMDLILPFFAGEFQDCLVGKADLKEVVKPYLSKWGWIKSVDELLAYWFNNENYIDKRIAGVISKIRKEGIKCYLHSNQEKYRTDFMKKQMKIDAMVDGVFSSAYLGVKKPQAEFWQQAFDKIQPVKKSEVLVWDDDEENIASAAKFGFNAELYKDYSSFNQVMSKYKNK